MRIPTSALWSCLYFASALGHSWVERLNLYYNGEVQLITFGYARGNGKTLQRIEGRDTTNHHKFFAPLQGSPTTQ